MKLIMNKDFRYDNVALLFTSSRKLDNIQSGLKDCMLVGSKTTSCPIIQVRDGHKIQYLGVGLSCVGRKGRGLGFTVSLALCMNKKCPLPQVN